MTIFFKNADPNKTVAENLKLHGTKSKSIMTNHAKKNDDLNQSVRATAYSELTESTLFDQHDPSN